MRERERGGGEIIGDSFNLQRLHVLLNKARRKTTYILFKKHY